MKKILATVAAMAIMVSIASVASAADRLTVKDSGGVVKFKVDETGAADAPKITTPKLGVGTSNPLTPLHNSDNTTIATRGVMVAQHNDGSTGASIAFRKSRGSEADPRMPDVASDYIGIFASQYWNGQIYDRNGQFGFRNDAAPTSPTGCDTNVPQYCTTAGTMPSALIFYTGKTAIAGQSDLTEGMRISSIKNVVVGNAGGSATVDLAPTATSGFLYIPSVSGALTTCGTVPAGRTATVGAQHPGHVPVWFDTSSSKICTCQGSTLKCTAALL